MKKIISQFVSQSEFARMQGVSPQRVGQWVRDSIITLTSGRRVNVEEATLQLKHRLDFQKREDWESTFNTQIRPKKIEDGSQPRVEVYQVVKDFYEKIDGKRVLIPKGSTIRITSVKGRKHVEALFLPPGEKKAGKLSS